MDWIGLDWIGLDWIGLDWIGLDGMGWDGMGLNWIGQERIEALMKYHLNEPKKISAHLSIGSLQLACVCLCNETQRC